MILTRGSEGISVGGVEEMRVRMVIDAKGGWAEMRAARILGPRLPVAWFEGLVRW